VNHQPELDVSRSSRNLLRKLRDLNLAVGRLVIRDNFWVRLAGCLSVDRPVENGVHYRVVSADGREARLALVPTNDNLQLALTPNGLPSRELSVVLQLDPSGAVTIPELSARIDVAQSGIRDLEHFMRRVVRTLLADSQF